MKNIANERRIISTIRFVESCIDKRSVILDLGTQNEISTKLKDNNFNVFNTNGEDLDIDFSIVESPKFDVITAFEIFEHMVCPFNLLRGIKAKKLIASVPLRLWFSNAYWGTDVWDRHYHEFEVKQFDMLLEKSGWKIIKSEKWKSFDNIIGIRPLLRRFHYRYYIVYCERLEN